jgi:hypothetical protein
MRRYIIVLSTKYWGDEIKEDEMRGACNTHKVSEKFT